MSHDKNTIAKNQVSTPTTDDIKNNENIDFNKVDESPTSKVEPSYKLLLSLAQELKLKKQYQDAKEVFQQIFEKYPEKPQGLRGLIQISQQTNDWQQVIDLTSLLIDKFPEVCQGYWSKGNAYLKLKKYTQARNQFSQLQELFPNEILGIVGLIKLAKERNNLQLMVKLMENFINDFPNIWQSYWYDSDMKNKMHIDYINALLDTGKVNEAESIACHFQDIYPEHISIHYALILIYQKKQEYNKSFNHFELSIKLTNNSLIKKDIIILSKVTFMKLKFFSEYEDLVNELMESFPNRVDVLSAWLELPVLGLPLIQSWEVDIEKLEEILDRKPNHIKFSDERASLLLSTDRLKVAEVFLREQIQSRPRHLGLNRKYCICAHHRKDWKEAENRFDNFYKIFPNDKSDVFFYYIHVLYKLSKFDKLQAEYKKFNSKIFKNFDSFDALDELQSNLLLGNYEKMEDLDNYNHYKVKNKFEHLYKEENLSIKKVINNPKNEVLFICLGGIHENAPKQYALNKFENTNYFDKTMSIKKDNHSFQGLADKTTQFNYLLINDFSSSYCLIKKDKFLEKIKNSIKSIEHKYLVCIGSSAGAFSSIMIGQSIKADIVFAFMTRTQAFFSRSHEFYRDLQVSTQLFKPQDIDIGYMQYKDDGFYPKVYMTLCENEPLDMISTYSLNKKDPNLHITYCHSDVHNVMKYLGAKNVYKEITRVVEKELINEFKLPMQKNIFAHLEGYKYNS